MGYIMQAVVIARLMLPFLCDDEQQRKIYVRTMNNISYRKKYWWKDITGMITITLATAHYQYTIQNACFKHRLM